MAETGKGVEFGVVDGRVGADLGVVGYVAVGELAADDVGVLCQCGICRGSDLDVVGNSGVVVAIAALVSLR